MREKGMGDDWEPFCSAGFLVDYTEVVFLLRTLCPRTRKVEVRVAVYGISELNILSQELSRCHNVQNWEDSGGVSLAG